MDEKEHLEVKGSDILFHIETLLRIQKKSKYQMAVDLDIPRSSIQNWNRGTIPASDKLFKVARYLNTSMEYLITGYEEHFETPDHQLYLNIQNLSTDDKKLITELVAKLSH